MCLRRMRQCSFVQKSVSLGVGLKGSKPMPFPFRSLSLCLCLSLLPPGCSLNRETLNYCLSTISAYLPAAMSHAIMTKDSSSVNVDKSPIKCFLLYIILVMVHCHNRRKVTKKLIFCLILNSSREPIKTCPYQMAIFRYRTRK